MTVALQKYWLVMKWEARMAGHHAELHSDLESAELEATSFAEKHPGSRYVVLEAVGSVLVPANPSGSKVVPL